MNPKKRIFLSYPSKSKSEANDLRNRLDPSKYSIWNDDYIRAGDTIVKRLHDGFLDSDYCVLLLTKYTEQSAWCMQEVGAFWGARKPIIVYRPNLKVSMPALLAEQRAANNIVELVAALDETPPLDVLVKNIFTRAGGGQFEDRLHNLARSASLIRLVGTGLEILREPHFTETIIKRASKGECDLEVYLADPFSPAVESRLVEENLGGSVPVPTGLRGIIRRANDLTLQWRQSRPLPNQKFEVKLFTHGPTFALLAFDDTYFFYPYGCTRLGNFSPAFELHGGESTWKEVIGFFEQQFELVRRSSTSMARLTAHGKTSVHLDAELWPFAVYYVPPPESALYRFGTSVLGYDVQNNLPPVNSEFQKYVKKTKSFGFHMTVCDALYFLTPHERRTAAAEAEFITSDFQPFELRNLGVQAGVPDASSISLVPRDLSGTLEALNHEFVTRLYRRAVASNYTLGIAKADRDEDTERASLMIQKYLAPYILARFQPHFSLLSDVPPNRLRQLTEDLTVMLEREYKKDAARGGNRSARAAGGMTVWVDKLAVMSTRAKLEDKEFSEDQEKYRDYWAIQKEISLKT